MQTLNDITFDSLVKRYRQPLAAAAYQLCGNREAAQDIVQETFVDAYKGINGLRDPEKAGAWLYTILRRKAASHHRNKKPEVEMIAEPTAPGPEKTESMVRDIVIEQMDRLSREDREILAGKYLLGLSYQELASSLGIKEPTVRVRCLRAKERLRMALRDAGVTVPSKRETEGDRNGV